ncbi:TonB-dependent receptor [Massilia yuzhufengensis]|uniref:Outer membrane receptor proteins, mostly Fe transport n=1 Tax=Massilia yuzhufengensis TaxID=1164594 RepID=A0A1I1WI36_9BURK|nr:TonB-dependent receptor [Massilia yuzhufengensis]SFD94855.1 Outer membrane receptor proteins, mostly Fe transport [Massilia yuzhufengensis]
MKARLNRWVGPVGLLLATQGVAAAGPEGAALARVEIVGVLPFADAGIEADRLPYALQSLDREALRDGQGGNLVETMARKLNGVTVNEITGSPFQVDLSYRGFRASPLLGTSQGLSVYLDGVRINEGFGDVVNWDMVPEAAIGRLALVPGSNPLYGLNTLGGAIALETRSGLTDPGADLAVTAGSHGRRRVDLAYGANRDGWHGFVAATLFDEEGWRRHSAGHLANALVKLGRKGSATDWSATLSGGRSRLLGNGLLPDGLYDDDRRAVYTYPDRSSNRVAQGSLRLTHRLRPGMEINALAYVRDSRRDTVGGDVGDAYADYVEDCADGFEANGEPEDRDECGFERDDGEALHPASLNTTATRQRGSGASINLHRRAGANAFDVGATLDRSRVRFAQFEQEAFFTPSRGVDANPEEEIEPASSVTGSARMASAYAAATLGLGRGTDLTLSARFNRARVGNTLVTEDGPKPHESFTYSRLNPSIGLTHARGGLTWFANAAQSNRVPTVIELGCADPAEPCRLPVGLQSDPYLKQVVSRTVEAGVRSEGFGATVFRTVNRDDILFGRAGATRAGYFSNFERTVHQGAELDWSFRKGGLFLKAGYSYLDATYGAPGTLFTGARSVRVDSGTRIAGLPRHTLKLNLDWEFRQGLVLGAELRALSRMASQGNEDGRVDDEGDASGDWGIAGHALLNLHANWTPAPGWQVFARIGNALDRRHESFGALAVDLFPGGRLLQPHTGAVDPEITRFVAPGAPRTLAAGLRYRF